MKEKRYRRKDVANLLGVHVATVAYWIKTGRLKAYETDDIRNLSSVLYPSKKGRVILESDLKEFSESFLPRKYRVAKTPELGEYINCKIDVFNDLGTPLTNRQIEHMYTLDTDLQIDNFTRDIIMGRSKI